jgi:hypothetical protein
MARNLHSDFDTAIQASEIHPILIAKISTAGGDVRVWTGIGDLTFNAETYIGTGTFGGVTEVQERTDLSANGIGFTLSGVPSDIISTALGEVEQGRDCTLWLALLNTSSGALINNPYEIFAGFTDIAVITEGAETSSIVINAENRMISLERTRVRRYTHEDQVSEHSGDKGFEFVPTLQDKVVMFGKS